MDTREKILGGVREKVIACLEELNEPLSLAELTNHFLKTHYQGTPDIKIQKKCNSQVVSALHFLCQNQRLICADHLYMLPAWSDGGVLHKKYQLRFEEKRNAARVAIVGNPSFRRKVKHYVESLKNFSVYCEANTISEFQAALQGIYGPHFLHICMVECKPSLLASNEVFSDIHNKINKVKVLTLCIYHDQLTLISPFPDESHGFVVKPCTIEELTEVLLALHDKGRYWQHNHKKARLVLQKQRNRLTLSPKEQLFLELCLDDVTYAEIAEKMGKSPRTIDGYREELFRRFKVNTRAGLIMLAIRNGFLKLP